MNQISRRKWGSQRNPIPPQEKQYHPRKINTNKPSTTQGPQFQISHSNNTTRQYTKATKSNTSQFYFHTPPKQKPTDENKKNKEYLNTETKQTKENEKKPLYH